MKNNPYGAALGSLDPMAALAETPDEIRTLVASWNDERMDRSYAPGKWTAREILVHLAQTELALTTRVRFAATEDHYRSQPFNQDAWLTLERQTDARVALDAYLALRRMNLSMFKALTPAQRTRTFTHPEYGELTVEWVLAMLAGHERHHLAQLQTIG